MRLLFFTPFFNQPRGNATTAKRIIHFLQRRGIETFVFPYMEDDLWNLPAADVIHILHATRFVVWAAERSYTIRQPYLVTLGGTDINHDMQTDRSTQVQHLLDRASFITVFTEDAKDKVTRLSEKWGDKTIIIPQTAWISQQTKKARNFQSPRILLPAGLRPVKDVLHVLPALDRLAASCDLTFTILGAALNQQVYQDVMRATRTRPWMSYAGVVPFEVMTQWYNQSNIVINTSISEGQSLAVMEAMALGRPVVARSNAANQSLIEHGKTGWLYETNEQFEEAIKTIMTDSALREQVISQARAWIKTAASPQQEADQYIELYKRAGE